MRCKVDGVMQIITIAIVVVRVDFVRGSSLKKFSVPIQV